MWDSDVGDGSFMDCLRRQPPRHTWRRSSTGSTSVWRWVVVA